MLHLVLVYRHLAGDDPAEREAAVLGLSGCAYMEWMEPDAAVEAAFAPVDAVGNARTVTVAVDVSGGAPQLIFFYAPLEQVQESGEVQKDA